MTEFLVLVLFLSPACFVQSVGENVSTLTTTPEPAVIAPIYEAHASNLRHRHNHPWGPHFEDNPTNVTIREGQNIFLDCKVELIGDKVVSWVRRKSDQLDLLTLGTTNHSSDARFSSDFKYPNNWRLFVRNVSRNDSAPEVFIVNSRGERINDVHYKEGGNLQLTCIVTNLKSRSLNWFRNSVLLNHDVSRGGVSIKTEMNSDHAKSVLNLARITRQDIGIYSCKAPPHNFSVTVHILNGENPQQYLYHNIAATFIWPWKCFLFIFLLWMSK